MTMQNAKIFIKKHWVTICLAVIMLVSFFLMIFSARTDSMVVDEKVHIPAGFLHVWKGNYTFNSEHPPLLNDLAGLFARIAHPNVPAVPADFNGGDQWNYGDMFFYKSQNNVESILFWARLPFIFLTLALVYLVFLWARTLFGAKAGLVAAILTAFSPNILAHGRLATTDIGVAFFFLLALWFLRKYHLRPNFKTAALLGIGLGLVLLAKFSGIFVLPVIFLGVISTLFSRGIKVRTAIWQIFIITIIPLILIWAVYAFSTRTYLKHLPPIYELSRTLQHKTLSHTYSKWLIVPYDKFLQGLEILLDHNTSGHWAYLDGKVDYNGWWYYFPLVLLYKMTLAEIILFFLAIFIFWKLSKSPPVGGFDKFLLIFPPLLFLAISMFGRIDIGIRHILPILPFFYILISGVAVKISNFYLKTAVWLLIVAQIVIGLLAFPNYIDYFNLIGGGARGGLRHLDDSNLDWNQNMNRFGAWARENNVSKVYELCWDEYSFSNQGVEAEILPNSPVKGVVVICAEQLKVPPDGFDFAWVLNPPTGGPPDVIIGGGIYVWRFDEKTL